MKDHILFFIPNKIRVAFTGYDKDRKNTFSGNRGYIGCYDEKDNLLIGKSWSYGYALDSGKVINNVPTKGFVINKHKDGAKGSCFDMPSYLYVYDPRGFDVEITSQNLAYILEHTHCKEGEFEGTFVYAYDGDDFFLLPTSSSDYDEMVELSQRRFGWKRIKNSELEVGVTYKDSKGAQYIFLGKLDYYKVGYFCDGKFFDTQDKLSEYLKTKGEELRGYPWPEMDQKLSGKRLYFYKLDKNGKGKLVILAKKPDFVETISSEPVSNLQELLDKLLDCPYYNPVDRSKEEILSCSYEEVNYALSRDFVGLYAYDKDDKLVEIFFGRTTDNTRWITQVYPNPRRPVFTKEELAHRNYNDPYWTTLYDLTLDDLFERFKFVKFIQHQKDGRVFNGSLVVDSKRHT